MSDSAEAKRMSGGAAAVGEQDPEGLAIQFEQLVERRDIAALDELFKVSAVHPRNAAEAIGIFLSGSAETSSEGQAGRSSRLGKLLGEVLARGADLKPVLEHFFDRVSVRSVGAPGVALANPKVEFLQGLAFGSRAAPRIRFELLHLADQSRDRFVAKEAQNLLKPG